VTATTDALRLERPPSAPPHPARGRTKVLRGAAGLLAILVLWQLSVPLIGLEPYFYPSPVDVWRAFLDLMRKGILPAYLADSFGRFAAGVALGLSLGVAFGLLIGLSRTASRLLGPLISFLFAIVEVAWIPLFVIWWGYGLKTILVALAYVVFFPVLYNTIVGVRTVPTVLVNAARSLGAGRWAVLREVVLPSALPNIITGVRVGTGFAFRGLIFAEIIAAKSGIGFLIFEGATNQQTDRTIVGMIVMGLLWLFIDNVYVKPVECVTVERWGTVTTAEARQ
jgi:NitT/TauT family transport system permease protein/taurine transport system permease protein